MAYDSNLRKLWDEPDSGITPQEVSLCIQDYRVDELGNVDIGMMCTSPKINKWKKNKPFRSPVIAYPLTEAGDAQKAKDRKAANQGLLIPTAANAGITSQNVYGWTYLGRLAYYATQGLAPNYTYLQPRGLSSTFNEPYRIHDFDGYSHFGDQPFKSGATLIYADGRQVPLDAAITEDRDLNRFEVKSIRFYIQTSVDADITLDDLLYGTDGRFYYLVAELYRNHGNAFYENHPDVILRHPDNMTTIEQHNGFASVDLVLSADDDDTRFDTVVGINRYASASSDVPETMGAGFIAPWKDNERPYTFSFRQTYHGVLEGKPYQGYYRLDNAVDWTIFDIPDRVMKTTHSDIIGISLNMSRMNANYYVIGQNGVSGVPSDAVTFMFKLIYAGQTSREVIGRVANADLTNTGNNAALITMNGDAQQTVYLRFDGMLEVGDYIQNGILMVSADRGQTWTYVESPSSGGWSSIALYIKRTA